MTKRKLNFIFILSIALCLAIPMGSIFRELGYCIVAQFYCDVVTLHKASVTYFEYILFKDEELANFKVILGSPISSILNKHFRNISHFK